MITDEDLRRLDDRFVSKSECEIRTAKTNENISKMGTDLAVVRANMERSSKLIGVITGAAVTSVVTIIVAVIIWAIKQGAV